MNKKLIMASIMTAALLLSGCQKETPENKVTEAVTTVTEVSVTEAPAESTTVETTAETEVKTETTAPETEITTEPTAEDKTDTEKDFSKASDWNFISKAKKGDGFITYDPQNITDSITDVGMSEIDLSKSDMLDNSGNKKAVYRFKIQNAASVGETDGVYMTTVVRDDGMYFVAFGQADISTPEEVIPYCTKNMEVEYWAFGDVSDEGIPVLIPFVAGSEESGYYLILPSLKQLGQDVGDMTPPSFAVGNAINGTEPTAPTTSQNDIPPSSDNSKGNVYLDITGINNSDIITSAECKLVNNSGKNIFLTNSKLLINGTDYSDKFTAFLEAENGETIYDELFFDGVQLYAGDKLELYFEVGDSDTYEELGIIKFAMELEAIS